MSTTLEMQIRGDSIVEMNKGMLKSILDTSKVHGHDPQIQSMITAALYMTISDLDKAFPGTKLVLQEMLER